MTTPQVEISPVWQSYVDITNDVKPFLQWPTGVSAQDGLLQNVIDAACWWAQDTLGQPIALTEFFRRFDGYQGWGSSTVSLPYRPVVVDGSHTITVVEWWGASGPHTLTMQTPAAQGGSDMFTLDALEGIIFRSYLGLLPRPTFPGLRNIEVTWWAGYNPVPLHYRYATLRLIRHWWAHDFQSQVQGFQRGNAGEIPHEYFPLIPDDVLQVFQTGWRIGIA